MTTKKQLVGKENPYRSIATLSPITDQLQTEKFFAASSSDTGESPLDSFITNANQLNLLASGQGPIFASGFGPILLLGYVSAVESYLRALIVELIEVDEVAQDLASNKEIPFGATLCSASTQDCAGAILETRSLANRNEVVDVLRQLLGIKNVREPLEALLKDFQAICEIRHCCVHRFGRLGPKNAIVLGLNSHGNKVGEGFTVDPVGFEKIALRLRSFVKAVNNLVWEKVMERTARNRDEQGKERLYTENWTWNWQKDRRRFTRYWQIFSTQRDSVPSQSARDMYEIFRRHHRLKPPLGPQKN